MTDQNPAATPPGDEEHHGEDMAPPQAEEKWPFTFILTIVMVSLYLGWRLVQGLILLWDWLF